MNPSNLRRWLMPAGIVCAGLLTNGCGSKLLQRNLSEGVITYALSFPEYDPSGLMAGMLPEKTTLTFSDDRQVAELSAGMGVFKTTMIADLDDHHMDYQMSVMSKKMIAHLQQRDMKLFNEESGRPTILYTSEVDTIAGYPCKKAVAVYDDISKPEIDLYYTDQIDMENPNWFGPFSDIPGVLMRYELIQYGMRMRLDATEVLPGPVDESKFTPNPNYQKVSPEVLHSEMEEVLSTFSM